MPDTTPLESPFFFPTTSWDLILEAKAEDASKRRAALEKLMSSYLRPVFWFLRSTRKASPEDAADLTQEFFVKVLEQGVIQAATPDRGRFRSFLLGVLKNFLADQRRHETRQKRGGGVLPIPLEELTRQEPEWEPVCDSLPPDQVFALCWSKSILLSACQDVLAGLEREGKSEHIRVFTKMFLDVPPQGPPTYKEVARELSLDPVDVAHRLAHVKRLVKIAVRKKVGEYTASPEELEDEMRELFGSIE